MFFFCRHSIVILFSSNLRHQVRLLNLITFSHILLVIVLVLHVGYSVRFPSGSIFFNSNNFVSGISHRTWGSASPEIIQWLFLLVKYTLERLKNGRYQYHCKYMRAHQSPIKKSTSYEMIYYNILFFDKTKNRGR